MTGACAAPVAIIAMTIDEPITQAPSRRATMLAGGWWFVDSGRWRMSNASNDPNDYLRSSSM
jgi:hypothetical protein